MKQTPAEKVWSGFKDHFGVQGIFMHDILAKMSGKYELDIIKFETWLTEQGYKPGKKGSMADFVKKEIWGESFDVHKRTNLRKEERNIC